MLPVAVQVAVVGLNSSVVVAPEVPPATSTSPVVSSVSVCRARATAMVPPATQVWVTGP